MKAIVVSQYGGPEAMKFLDWPDPSPGKGEVLVRVAAASVNPIDIKRLSGEAKNFEPITFPDVLGVDVAGTVVSCGPEVTELSVGDRVFGMADHTYAELCVVKAERLAKIPAGLGLIEAAALPLVTTTGYQLITNGAHVSRGQLVLVTGALGNVGRAAVFTAKSQGAKVIAGVRKKQTDQAATLGVDGVVAVDDQEAVVALQALDAVADTVNGTTAELLIGKVKSGGIFATVLRAPKNSADFASVKVAEVYSTADPKALLELATGVLEGRLVIPIAAKKPLRDAAEAHEMVAEGVKGKVLLVP
jgi:NADPH:quinone reductase-like Zn-dependent oxidoreductase